jgi:hypothetical protein
MNRRPYVLGFRANDQERQQIAAMAQRLERSESDTIRLVLRREAERMGVTPTNESRRPTEAGVRT